MAGERRPKQRAGGMSFFVACDKGHILNRISEQISERNPPLRRFTLPGGSWDGGCRAVSYSFFLVCRSGSWISWISKLAMSRSLHSCTVALCLPGARLKSCCTWALSILADSAVALFKSSRRRDELRSQGSLAALLDRSHWKS